jgi:hypothetical protein
MNIWIYRVLQKELYNLHIYVHVSCKALFDQKVSVYLMITAQKHAKIFETVTITCHDNVVSILNTVFVNTVRRINKRLETGGGHSEHHF